MTGTSINIVDTQMGFLPWPPHAIKQRPRDPKTGRFKSEIPIGLCAFFSSVTPTKTADYRCGQYIVVAKNDKNGVLALVPYSESINKLAKEIIAFNPNQWSISHKFELSSEELRARAAAIRENIFKDRVNVGYHSSATEAAISLELAAKFKDNR